MMRLVRARKVLHLLAAGARWEVLMRRLVILIIAANAFGCSNPQQVTEQMPMPPSQRAPICARPIEKASIDTSALLSELQIVTISCHADSKYNALIPRLRPALATKEKNLSAFFARAYGKHGQSEHDKYITELANTQSQLALKSGQQFCSFNSGMFDQVMPLSTIEELAAYAQSRRIQQALSVDECSDTPPPVAPSKVVAPRGKGRQKSAKQPI
jgi:hypothetical protein